MPKIIELTVEVNVERVSCPGVWLCQDGRVSLTVFALGTSYQTCLLPPIFPLMFKDIFYFRKRFQETCALNNICCLLKDETIYCELVQWCEDCTSNECVVLAQYLGALNEVLFPPNMCSNDGVDLLMRRSKHFPGILSPKIEIATKVRIDEVWNQPCSSSPFKLSACKCMPPGEAARQKQVCHSARYHRHRCVTSNTNKEPPRSRSRSKSRSEESRSCCSLAHIEVGSPCRCYNPVTKPRCAPRPRRSPRRSRPCPQYRQYCVYRAETRPDLAFQRAANGVPSCPDNSECDEDRPNVEMNKASLNVTDEERMHKTLLESCYIDVDRSQSKLRDKPMKFTKVKISPCLCEICKKYHQLFHSNKDNCSEYL